MLLPTFLHKHLRNTREGVEQNHLVHTYLFGSASIYDQKMREIRDKKSAIYGINLYTKFSFDRHGQFISDVLLYIAAKISHSKNIDNKK